MGFLLNQGGHLHSHSHGHGHSHGSAPSGQRSQGSLAVRAAFIHALGDLLQSVGVLIAAYIVRFKVTAQRDTSVLIIMIIMLMIQFICLVPHMLKQKVQSNLQP